MSLYSKLSFQLQREATLDAEPMVEPENSNNIDNDVSVEEHDVFADNEIL